MLETIGVIAILLAIYSLASTCGLFSERSGTVNLAIEGGMTFGALGYVIVTYLITEKGDTSLQVWMVLLGVITSIVFGIFITSFLSFTAINLRGNHVVIGTAINIMVPVISLAVVVLLTTGSFNVPMSKLQITTGIKSDLTPWQIQLIILGLVMMIMIYLYILMKKTRFGLRIRASGENPHALAATGVSVLKVKHYSMLIAGALAGFAGALAVSCYSKFSSYTNTSLGMGFIAIAILILGQWRIQWIIIGALVFSAMFAVVDRYSVNLAEYKYIFALIPYTFTILILPIISKYAKPPQAAGVPYYNKGR